MYIKNKKYFIIFLAFIIAKNYAIQNTNIPNSYDWLFDSVRLGNFPDSSFSGIAFKGRFEKSFHTDGYLSDDEDCMLIKKEMWRIKSNPLQYLEDHENIFTAFLGNESSEKIGSFLQQYTLYGGVTGNNLAVPLGKVSFDAINFSAECWVSENLRLGFYWPLYKIELSNVSWVEQNKKNQFEQYITDKLLDTISNYTDLNIKNYSLFGFGDSLLLISWQDSFIENREIITGITCSMRAGLHLPTKSLKDTENSLLRLSLGMDSGIGIHMGGAFAIDLGYYNTFGIAADCTKLFGKITKRRIKTDLRQTDLVLLAKELSYINPGFKQQFFIYSDFHTLQNNWNGTFGYQYIKQNESDILLCTDKYINSISEGMQRLESWSTHSLVGLIQKQWNINNSLLITGIFGKWGFNGSRAIVCNSIGLNLEYMF